MNRAMNGRPQYGIHVEGKVIGITQDECELFTIELIKWVEARKLFTGGGVNVRSIELDIYREEGHLSLDLLEEFETWMREKFGVLLEAYICIRDVNYITASDWEDRPSDKK